MRLYHFLVIIFTTTSLLAQPVHTSSELLKKIANESEDTVKAKLYLKLGKLYYQSQYDSAYLYFNKGLKIARDKKLSKIAINLLISKSRLIIYEGNYNDALDTLKKVVRLATKNDMQFTQATALNSIGVVFFNKSQYDSCKYYWHKSLNIYEEINDSSGISTANSNMGVVNYVQGNAEIALKHYLKALEIRKKLELDEGMASLYMKIALIYKKSFKDDISSYNYVSEAVRLYRKNNNKLGETRALINKGNALKRLDSTKRAMAVYNLALKNAEEIGNKRLLSGIYATMGMNYTEKRQYKKALGFFYKARDLNESMGQIKELSNNYVKIGNIYLEIADYNTALSYYQKSLELFEKLNLHAEMSDVFYAMSETAAKMKNYKKAYKYYQKYAEEKDSVSVHENKELLAEMEARFANEKNKQRIQFLEQEQLLKDEQLDNSKIIRNLLIGMAVLVFAIALLFYQRIRQKTAINKELREKNEQVKFDSEQIQYKSGNTEEFNKQLLEKNKVIQQHNTEMVERNKTNDRIFSIIGHDLRSPMASIYTSLKLLRNNNYSAEKISHIYDLIENDIVAATDLLENLLMWAKNQEGQMKLVGETQSFDDVAQKVLKTIESIAQSKEITIKYASANNDDAFFDRPMLSAVLRNLLVNAVKFTKMGGTVKLEVESNETTLSVSVVDDGIGMEKETIEKVKQKGNYHTQPGTNKEKGSGLGLSLCFDLIEMHNGEITIESQPGYGSVFTFTIPKKQVV